MSNCTYCQQPIVLTPSATERARKFGGKPSDYSRQFTAHSECQIKARTQASTDLVRSICRERASSRLVFPSVTA